MTVAVLTTSSGPYTAAGATVFPFTFSAGSASEVQVTVNGAIVTVGFTISLNSNQSTAPGGNVTFTVAPANGTVILIASNPSFQQLISFKDSGPFLQSTLDIALDRMARLCLYLKDKLSRAVVFPLGETVSTLPSATARAGKFLGFDGSGNFVALGGTSGDPGLRADLAAATGFGLVGGLTDDIKAESQGAVFDNGTDDHAGVIAAIALSKTRAGNTGGGGFYKGGPTVVLPAGKTAYVAVNALDINHTMILRGAGSGRFGPSARGASALRFAAGTTGIRSQHPNTSGDITVDGTTHDGSGGVNLKHFMLQGPGDGVEASVDGSTNASLATSNIGIDCRDPITGYDLYIKGFRGIGVKGWAGTYGATNYGGNTSLTTYYGTKVEATQIGFDFRGSDTNILNFFNCEAYQCTQAGFVFDVGIGPVVGVGIHTASNGLITGYLSYMCAHNGDGTWRRYAAVWGTSIATLTANAPPNGPTNNAYWHYIEDGGTDTVVKAWDGVNQFRAGGDIITAGPVNPNQVACFIGAYSENPGVSQFGDSTLLVSCDIARKYRIGGVHIYALNGSFHCDESADFGGNVIARGNTFTLGDNASATASDTVLNLDNTNVESSIVARTTGGAVVGNIAWVAGSGASYLAPSTSGHSFSVGPVGSPTAICTISLNGLLVSSGALGYATGVGGAVTQITSRTTAVTLNKICGQITLFSAAGTATWQTFTVNNNKVAGTDVIRVIQASGTDKYMIHVTKIVAGASFDITFATTGGTTTEQPVFNFAILKAVAA